MEHAPKDLFDLIWAVGSGLVVIQMAVVAFFLKEQAKALKENSHSVVRLTAQMELVLREIHKIPSLEQDINKIGNKLRSYDS